MEFWQWTRKYIVRAVRAATPKRSPLHVASPVFAAAQGRPTMPAPMIVLQRLKIVPFIDDFPAAFSFSAFSRPVALCSASNARCRSLGEELIMM